MGESSPVDELHPNAFACQALDEGARVIEVSGEPVHAVHDHGGSVAGEPQQFRELWAGRVPAGGLVREDPVQNLAFELAALVLVQRARPYVPTRCPTTGASDPRPVNLSFRLVSDNS